MHLNPAARHDLEMEIKYAVLSDDDLATAKRVFLALTPEILRERDFTVIMRYYDTPAFDPLQSGTTLRKMDECLPLFVPEIHIKTIGHATDDGILLRDEYRFTLPNDSNDIDLSSIDRPDVRDMMMPAADQKLSEVFRTVNARNDIRAVFNINAKRAVIELSVENTVYLDACTGAELTSAFEIELELNQHHSDAGLTHDEALGAIRQIGDALAKEIPSLRTVTASKAETGFSFFRP